VAPPLRPLAPIVARDSDRPKVLVIPEHDQFCPPLLAAERTEGWKATRLEVVPGADHFLIGRADRVVALCLELLQSLAAAA
jgi:alpha/beta superfamily hydrolase